MRTCQEEVSDISVELKDIRDIIAKRGEAIAKNIRRIIQLETMITELQERLEQTVSKSEFQSCKEEMEYMVYEALDDIRVIYNRLEEIKSLMELSAESDQESQEQIKMLRRITMNHTKRLEKLEGIIDIATGRV